MSQGQLMIRFPDWGSLKTPRSCFIANKSNTFLKNIWGKNLDKQEERGLKVT